MILVDVTGPFWVTPTTVTQSNIFGDVWDKDLKRQKVFIFSIEKMSQLKALVLIAVAIVVVVAVVALPVEEYPGRPASI